MSSFDYRINIKDPVKATGNNNYYAIPLEFCVKINNNFYGFENYFIKTINGLSLTGSEINNIRNTGKKIYTLNYGKISTKDENMDYKFRSPISLVKICDMFFYLRVAMLNFTIEFTIGSDIFLIRGDQFWDHFSSSYREGFESDHKRFNVNFNFYGSIWDDNENRFKKDFNKYKYKSLKEYEAFCSNEDFFLEKNHFSRGGSDYIKISLGYTDPNLIFAYTFDYIADLEEVSKITHITIKPNY